MVHRIDAAGTPHALLRVSAAYAVDAFDFMIYSFLIPTLIATWGMSKSEAGMIATSSLISSALRRMACRHSGRPLWPHPRAAMDHRRLSRYSRFCPASHSFWQLLATRTLQGIGFGGEWSVVTIMMAETIRSAASSEGRQDRSEQLVVRLGDAAIIYWAFFALLPEQVAWHAVSGSASCRGVDHLHSAATSATRTFISQTRRAH